MSFVNEHFGNVYAAVGLFLSTCSPYEMHETPLMGLREV